MEEFKTVTQNTPTSAEQSVYFLMENTFSNIYTNTLPVGNDLQRLLNTWMKSSRVLIWIYFGIWLALILALSVLFLKLFGTQYLLFDNLIDVLLFVGADQIQVILLHTEVFIDLMLFRKQDAISAVLAVTKTLRNEPQKDQVQFSSRLNNENMALKADKNNDDLESNFPNRKRPNNLFKNKIIGNKLLSQTLKRRKAAIRSSSKLPRTTTTSSQCQTLTKNSLRFHKLS